MRRYGSFRIRLWEILDKGLTARLSFLRERSGKEKKGSSVKPWRTEKMLPLPVLHVNVQVDRSFVFRTSERTAVSTRPTAVISSPFSMAEDHQDPSLYRNEAGILPLPSGGVGRAGSVFPRAYVKKVEQDACLYVFPAEVPTEEIQAACQECWGIIEQKESF